MSKQSLFIIILVLFLGNLFFGWQFSVASKEAVLFSSQIEAGKINRLIVDFTLLFINKVLRAEGEVDFETRLQLENMVRAINDKEILAQWQKFVGSKTEIEAQLEVRNLLELLVKKVGGEVAT